MTKDASFALLDAFVAAGGNFIDTANNYQNEESETWIGEWMRARGNRDQLVVATKYTGAYQGYEPGLKGKVVNCAGNSKRSLQMSVRDSLRKLQTDYIDILYVHWWDYTTSVAEVMDSLHALVMSGKVLYLGISNTPAWIVSAANTYATLQGRTPFSIYQGRWNVLHRDFEREVLPMARQFGMALAPWDAIGGGKFQTEKALRERQERGDGSLRKMMGSDAQSEDEIRMSPALAKVAAEHGIESVTAIALAYVLAKVPYVFPLIGGRRVEYLYDNIQALSIRLSEEQIRFLESVKPLDVGYPQNMLGEEPGITGHEGMALAPAGKIAFVRYPRAIGYE